jgi:DNA-binding CsgD family transcriptional regulator/tetratricopeptide (TPR) repeat protein
VANRAGVARRPLVGRAGELDAVIGLVRGAARCEAGALLIAGEAGVGKTALVRDASARVGSDADVLWAPCLPLTSLAMPFLPLASALREWAAGRDLQVPVMSGSAGEGPTGFDAWLEAQCRQRPVLLVVDDLQWADQSSLDVLMYVLAGLAARRLAVVTTVRTGEEGDPLRRWLADVRRFPGVTELYLGRLDRFATGEQLGGLLGRPPHQSLVDEVYARSQGNAYLTALLVRSLSPDSRSLPAGLPADLQDAATRAWRGLSPRARAITRLVAVAGRPQRADQLADVAGATGSGRDVVPLLREAIDGSVLEVGADNKYWFVHPLLAEVLERELLPEERATLYAAFAVALGSSGNADQMDVERVVDLADHHYRAGHPQEAYHWALLAADAADRAGGATEMLRLLRRALDLLPHVPAPGLSRIDLLRRIQKAAEQAGEQEEECAAVDELLTQVDREQQPLLVAELLVRRNRLQGATSRASNTVDDARVAVRLSAAYPESGEYALAVALLAVEELWHGIPSGPARADEAIRLARACGSAKALAHALTARVTARVFAGDGGGLAEAQEAQAAAAKARDFYGYAVAATWAANCLDISSANRDVTEQLRRGREELTALGAPHRHVARLAADEAFGLVLLGDWRTCVERLRVALGSTPGPRGDLVARVTAALLAVWQGRWAEAEAHLARAEELSDARFSLLFYGLDAIRAELALAAGHTGRAFAAAMAGVERGGHANLVERLVPLAARALADEAQAFRDQGEDPAPAVARLHDLRNHYPRVVAEVGPGPMYQVQVRAMQAWYDAEVQRGQDDPAAAAAWQRAAQACADGQLAWDEAYAWWRTAEALTKDRTARDEAAAALRRAHELAVDLQAAPLLSEVEALAHSARISLAAVDEGPPPKTDALPGLTPREREVLSHIVAGRTYGEIARELVLSEKTVSVHVSHLLHKTGTTNRIALAQLARRLATPQQTDPADDRSSRMHR